MRRLYLLFSLLALAPLLAARAMVIEDPRINRTEIPVPDARRALELGRGFFGDDANRFACRGLTSLNRAHGGGWLLWFQDTATGTQRCVRVTADETVSEPPERGYYRIKRWPAQDAAGAIARVLETQHGVPTDLRIPCPRDDEPARWNVVMLDGETVTSLRIEPDGRVEPANPWLELHAPPCRYEIGSGDDGGTLSGVAKLFYGNATRYREIFEANRDVLKSPDVVRKGMVLFIPAAAAAPPRKRTSPQDASARALALYAAFLDDPSERRLLDLLVESFAVDEPSEEYRAFLLGQFAGGSPARFKVGLADADEIDAWTVAYACAERFLALPSGSWPTRVVAICSRAEGTALWRFHLLRIDPAHLPAIRASLATRSPDAEESHAENAEVESHAESAEPKPHAENAESAEALFPMPDPATIVRYERFSREDGDGATHAVAKADGDEILALLANWKTFEELRPKPRQPGEPCITVQIRHPDLVLSCFRADGSSKSVRFFRIIDGSTKRTRLDIELPDVRWPRRVPDEPARAILAKLDAWSAADRAAFLAVPLPRTYVFRSTFWDGGTLSGVAKLFYGDGGKWRVVWEANKAAVPNPDYVLSGTTLVIPALPAR